MASRMGRRFTKVLFLSIVVAGVVVSAAAALRFTDDSCANDSGCRPPQGVVGSSYSHKVEISPGGGTGPYTYTVSSGSLPPGLSLNSSTGAITGTPSAAGTYNSYLDGGDACPDASACITTTPTPPCPLGQPVVEGTCRYAHAAAQRDFTIVINPGLRILTNSVPQNATIGSLYSAALEAQLLTNLNPPTGTTPGALTWTIVPGVGNGLPPGLALGNGVITGTPTTEATYTFRVQAAIDPTRSTFQTYSLTVRQPLRVTAMKPLAISPAPTLWEIGVPFSAKLTPSGGNGTYTYALAGGALPAGLAVAADGTIAGTPHVAGVSRATIRLTDGEGRTLDYPASFGVAQKLAVSTLLLRPAKVGKLYGAKITTTGGLLPKTWRVVAGPLPRGIRLDRQLGVLSGAPTKPGRYRVTFEAKDALRVTSSKTLVITVLA